MKCPVNLECAYAVWRRSRRLINPLIHQGQLEGAIIQGLGYALCEEMGIEDGRVMVSSLGDYKIVVCETFRLLSPHS